MVKAILFDFDGVIADTEPIHYKTFQETVKGLGIEIGEKRWYNEFVGIGSDRIMQTLFEENGIKENVHEWVGIRREKFAEYLEEKGIPLKKGLERFLELTEKKGMKRAIASGSREDSIKFVLRKANIERYFPVVCGTESVKNKKPHPEVFLLAAKKIGVNPRDCLIIEDSISGISAAKKANIQYVCIKSPATQELKGCPIQINDYDEFPIEILGAD